MFANQYYQLHLETIMLLTNALKVDFLGEPYEIMGLDIHNSISNPDSERFKKLMKILRKYHEVDLDLMDDQIILNFSEEIGSLKYELPNINELPYLDH